MYEMHVIEQRTYDHLRSCLDSAATERELRASGLFRQSPPVLLTCRGLACFGRSLVALGRWLERYAAAPA